MNEQLDRYEGSPLRLMLGLAAAFIPGGGLLNAAENAVLDRQRRLRQDRLHQLVEHLELDAVTLREAVDSDEGIHAIMVVLEAAQRTQSSEKQRVFAKLLSQYLKTGEFVRDSRKFEDFFSILDDLTETELRMLLILNGFDLGEIEGRADIWTEAKAKMGLVLEAGSDEVDARLSRLTRTGLCIEKAVWDGPIFSISPLYSQFVQYLELGNYRSL